MNFSTALSRLRYYGGTYHIVGIASAITQKGIAVLLTLTLFTISAWVLGPHDFGTFSILFSASGLTSVLATAGQQIMAIRFWSEYGASHDVAHLKGAAIFSFAALSSVAALTGIALFSGLAFFYPVDLAAIVAIFCIVNGFLLVTTHLMRPAIGIAVADGLGAVAVNLPPIMYLATCYLEDRSAELYMVFILMVGGAVFGTVVQAVLAARRVEDLFPNFSTIEPKYDLAAWKARSFRLWISNSLEASNQYVDVLVIGMLMSPTVTGAYFITTRLANVLGIVASSMNIFTSSKLPNFYYRGQFDQIDRLLDTVAMVTLAAVAAVIAAIVIGGHWMLLLFDHSYTPYYSALVVLSLGTAMVTAAGPSTYLLMFTGNENTFLKIIAGALAFRVAAFFVLIPPFNVMGAIAASTLSFALMAIALRHYAIRCTGIDGTLARLIAHRRSSPPPADSDGQD